MQFVVFQNFKESANQQKIHNYAAKTQDPAINDGNIFALNNDLLWQNIPVF